jgi:multidrug efflux pump subunit AcrB
MNFQLKHTSPFSTRMIFAVLTLIGFALVPRLSVQYTPSASNANININYSWSNAAPKAIEREVTTPLEGALSLVENIENIYSTSSNGQGNISVTLRKSANIDWTRFEIAMAVRRIYTQLPEGVSFPTITLNNPTEDEQNRPILTYSLNGKQSVTDLYTYAREVLSTQLSLLSDIRNIQVVGGNRLEWRVTYQANQLRVLGLRELDIQRALQAHFQTDALGIAHVGNQTFSVQLQTIPLTTAQDWQNIPIKNIQNRLITLGQIAIIERVEQPARSYYRINGKNSIRLLFYPEATANTIELAKNIQFNIQNIELPNGSELFLDDDATEYLNEELQKIQDRTLLSLAILLFFVFIVHRSWRHTLVVALSLVANLGVAAIGYFIFNIEMNLYALAGITVSFGLMIDNTIVMVHHIRHYQNLKVFPALLAATFTTIAALVIVFFLPEKWQLSLAAFSKVVIINLTVSLIIALLLIPALIDGLRLKPIESRKNVLFKNKKRAFRFHFFYKKMLQFIIRFRGWAIGLVILLFGLPVWLIPNQVENWETYNHFMKSERYTETIAPIMNRWLGGTLRLFSWYVYEGASYQKPEQDVLHVRAKMQQGSTIEQMNDVFLHLEKYISQYDKAISQYITKVSNGEYASMEIHFEKAYSRYFPYELKSKLIAYSFNLGGVEWDIFGIGKGFSNASGTEPVAYHVAMYGYNDDKLKTQAQIFANKLVTHPRVKTVNIEGNVNWYSKDRYEYFVEPDYLALAKKDLNWANFASQLQGFHQATYPQLNTNDGQVVRISNTNQSNNDLWRLNNVSLPIDSTKVRFSEIAHISKQKVSNAIHKENQQYLRMVEWEYTGSAKFGNAYIKKSIDEMELEMPLGYSMEWKDYDWGGGEQQQYVLLLLVIGLIFFICAVLFESLRQSLTIILLIPTSFIGIFLTFYWFDFQFDQGGYTAFILLSGLVVNSLILIINDYNGLRKKHPRRNGLDLYLKAFYRKAIPIILTILSTALGLLPFIIYGQNEIFWFSLAVGTIGGLVFSLFVIGLFIPIFFKIKNTASVK